MTKGVDVIAASVASPEAISSVLRKAQEHGIKVIAWDADAPPDVRSFFVKPGHGGGHRRHPRRRGGPPGRRGRPVRHHYRLPHGCESERMDQVHQAADGRRASEDGTRHRPSLRRPARQGDDGNQEHRAGLSRSESDPRDLFARRARRGGSPQAGRPAAGQADGTFDAESLPQLFARGLGAEHRPVEHQKSGLSDRLRRQGRARWKIDPRRHERDGREARPPHGRRRPDPSRSPLHLQQRDNIDDFRF